MKTPLDFHKKNQLNIPETDFFPSASAFSNRIIQKGRISQYHISIRCSRSSHDICYSHVLEIVTSKKKTHSINAKSGPQIIILSELPHSIFSCHAISLTLRKIKDFEFLADCLAKIAVARKTVLSNLDEQKSKLPKEIFQFTLPETNSSPLKMMVSNRNLQTSRGPLFSGANCQGGYATNPFVKFSTTGFHLFAPLGAHAILELHHCEIPPPRVP